MREERREYYFRAFVQSRLLHTIQESLEEAEFTSEEVEELTSALAQLTEEEQRCVLALPYEIRGKLFSRYHAQIAAGELSPAQMVAAMLAANQRFGYTLGYHLSSHDIPKKHSADGESWSIKGSELDDRDNMPMAYYSEDYLHRYKTKSSRYLYVVRAETGPGSAHKKDTSNRWGRATALSIIDSLPLAEVEAAIDQALQKEIAAAKAAAK